MFSFLPQGSRSEKFLDLHLKTEKLKIAGNWYSVKNSLEIFKFRGKSVQQVAESSSGHSFGKKKKRLKNALQGDISQVSVSKMPLSGSLQLAFT